ncbi:hypothetical protein QAD02_008172 [Eretmocerus hayati]|uniref:Uncharacterized protein n=1 Tax=Eretmocerus hayati TaxID=131215 RepID=A0ACC2NA26_9HYME|nr:hypothetical protein QAD02_008172 [Eretmocerus hayati]
MDKERPHEQQTVNKDPLENELPTNDVILDSESTTPNNEVPLDTEVIGIENLEGDSGQPSATTEQGNPMTEMQTRHSRIIGKIFVECREKLFMRKDNYLYFVDTSEEPCDTGARELQERNEPPRLLDLGIGEIKTVPHNNELHLVLPVRGEERQSIKIIDDHLTMGFRDLERLVGQEQLKTISVAKSNFIENIPWTEFMIKLRNLLRGLEIEIIICVGLGIRELMKRTND